MAVLVFPTEELLTLCEIVEDEIANMKLEYDAYAMKGDQERQNPLEQEIVKAERLLDTLESQIANI